MPSDLLSIGKSGANTARLALDVTAQNIANAATDGYVRRSVDIAEVASTGGIAPFHALVQSGSRVDGITRNADAFRQAEVRRTGADLARADAELNGLQNIETAIEQTGVFDAIVGFEAALQSLAADPLDGSLRAAVVESARTMAGNFAIADANLAATASGLRFAAGDGVDQANLLIGELARVNTRLSRLADSTTDQVALLDQRDLLLQDLSQFVGIAASINPDKTVTVRLGDGSGPLMVDGGTSAVLAMTTAADGTIAFTLDGAAVAPGSGSLAGQAQALGEVAATRDRLDTLAAGLIDEVNTAQVAGAAQDGSAGVPLLSGTGAANMALAFDDGALIATAPAGAGADSRDPANLANIRNALATGGFASGMNDILFDVSATVRGRQTMRDTIADIASQATVALQAQSGVDLDYEAVNLIRFQQAFQASSRVMQVASDIFDTLIGIG